MSANNRLPTNPETSPAETARDGSRRRFLRWLWLSLGGAALLEFSGIGLALFRQRIQPAAKPPPPVAAGHIDEFAPATVTAVGPGGFYLARLANGALLALSRTCTHLGCAVAWDEKQRRFSCPCHGSTFSLVGEVLNGPAPRPLDTYPVRLENGIVKVDASHPRRRAAFTPDQATWTL